MNATIEDVAPCRKRLRVELDANEVNETFDLAMSEVSNVAQLPGFRKGRVPRRVLERRFGEAIVDDVKARLFEKGFQDAMKENELAPMGAPDIDIEKLEAARDSAFAFDVEVDVRPQFELGEVKGLKLTEELAAPTDAEVDEKLEELKYRFAEHKDVDGPAEAGDIVEGAIAFTVDGEEAASFDERAFRLEGDTLVGYKVGDLVEAFAGAAAGDEKTLSFTVDDEHVIEDQRGKPGEVRVTVGRVLRTAYPEIDDAFAGRVGMESLEALRDQIRQSIEGDRRNEARQKMEEQAVDLLVEQHPFDLPAAAVERLAKDNLESTRRRMQMYGMPEEQIAEQMAEQEAQSQEQAERSIRRYILFDAIAEREEIRVTEQDFQRHLTMLANAYRTTPAQLVKDIQRRDGMEQMEHEIRDIKVTQFLLDNAEITTTAPAPDAAGETDAASDDGADG
ncbi:MAG: trigger factor [Planctomycetota bacterium]